MDKNAIEFVLNTLPSGRTVFYDFPGRYALVLLERLIGESTVEIRKIKDSRFAPLLEKPCVKRAVSRLGSGTIAAEDLLHGWPSDAEPYRLTVATWPDLDTTPTRRFDQITRWGWSLVLQVNASATHRRKLAEFIEDWESEYEFLDSHPIATGGELTIAWARIDLDLETDEALIEEIQSDWIRDVKLNLNWQYYDEDERVAWRKYNEKVLEPVSRRWTETTLTAAIWFLLKEIGISTIFFHTQEAGQRLKRIDGTSPPRSIYTSVPRKFCFEKTHNGPIFVRDSAKTDLRKTFMEPDTVWWVHEF